MTIIEALEIICKEQIPREINKVNTRYYIHEYKSVLGNEVVEVGITSTNINPRILIIRRYAYEWLISHDFRGDLDLTYCQLKDDMRVFIGQYIHDVIERTVTADE